MAERYVTPELLLRVIDEGQTRYSDDVRLWVWLDVPGRDDNLSCAVLVLERAPRPTTYVVRPPRG